MAIKVRVADVFAIKSEDNVDQSRLFGTVLVTFDDTDAAMQIDVAFPAQSSRAANEAKALACVKTHVFRLANYFGGLPE